MAANAKGLTELAKMVDHFSLDVVKAYMGHVQDAAEAAVRSRLKELSRAKGMQVKDTVRAVDTWMTAAPSCCR